MGGEQDTDATVKWFNPDKGFGFVALADGSGDAFLHIGVLQAAGHESVPPESKLKVRVGQGQRGRQVTAVLEVDTSTASASPPRRPMGGGGDRGPRMGGGGGFGDRRRPDPADATTVAGTLKWFNDQKGFGFAVADDGGKDVFIHISVVERAGIRDMSDGQRLSMQVVSTPKGREAISISPA
jgi:CspA family cold shock protein